MLLGSAHLVIKQLLVLIALLTIELLQPFEASQLY